MMLCWRHVLAFTWHGVAINTTLYVWHTLHAEGVYKVLGGTQPMPFRQGRHAVASDVATAHTAAAHVTSHASTSDSPNSHATIQSRR